MLRNCSKSLKFSEFWIFWILKILRKKSLFKIRQSIIEDLTRLSLKGSVLHAARILARAPALAAEVRAGEAGGAPARHRPPPLRRPLQVNYGPFWMLSPQHITLSEARSRLDRRRSWRPNSHFSAFFKIYKIFIILRRLNLSNLQNSVKN